MMKDTQNNEKEHEGTDLKTKNVTHGNAPEKNGANGAGETTHVNAAVDADAAQAAASDNAEAMKESLKKTTEELGKSREEIDSLKDIMKRRQADFENYKKRMLKSQDDFRKMAVKDMAFDIITINDDLHRAIEAAESVVVVDKAENGENTKKAFIDGVAMISRRIEDMLRKYGVVEIESLNMDFDPRFNEAVEIEESDGVEKDTITKVYLKGFALGDYVVRAARVKVTRPVQGRASNDGAKAQSDENGETTIK